MELMGPKKIAQFRVIVRWLMACVCLQSGALILITTKYMIVRQTWQNHEAMAAGFKQDAIHALRTRDVLLAYSLLKVPEQAYAPAEIGPTHPRENHPTLYSDGWMISGEDLEVALPQRTKRVLDALRKNPNTRLDALLPAIEQGYVAPASLDDPHPTGKPATEVSLLTVLKRSPGAPPLQRRLSTLSGMTNAPAAVPHTPQRSVDPINGFFPLTEDWVDTKSFAP